MQRHALKISVIGAAGRVGSATAFALVMRGLAEELVLVDRTTEAATGDAYDLRHAAAFVRPMDIRAGCLDASAGSDIVIVCASAPVADTSSRLAQATPKRHRLVVQVSDGDPAKWILALNNAGNVLADLGASNVDVEIVAYGPGIGMLKSSSPVGGRIADAMKAGVHVVACQNTMRGQKLTPADMLPQIGYVPAGVIELMKKQEEGWAYVRP